jgi:hypothetical protein
VAAFLVVISGCSADRRLAKEFVAMEERPPVIIKEPSTIYMVSYKETDTDTTGLKPWQVDSIRFHESDIVKHINPDSVRMMFFTAFRNQLEAFNFRVYQGKEIAEILDDDSAKPLIMHFPQMEMEEYTQPYTHEEYINRKKYYKNFDLDAVNLNTWLRLGRRGETQNEYYFISDSITDVVDGHYYRDKKSGRVKYRYKYHEVESSDVYHFMQDMGRNYAQYIFDHYLNRFVEMNRNTDGSRSYMYHYDPESEEFLLIRNQPWIEMESPKQ